MGTFFWDKKFGWDGNSKVGRSKHYISGIPFTKISTPQASPLSKSHPELSLQNTLRDWSMWLLNPPPWEAQTVQYLSYNLNQRAPWKVRPTTSHCHTKKEYHGDALRLTPVVPDPKKGHNEYLSIPRQIKHAQRDSGLGTGLRFTVQTPSDIPRRTNLWLSDRLKCRKHVKEREPHQRQKRTRNWAYYWFGIKFRVWKRWGRVSTKVQITFSNTALNHVS